VLLVGGLGFGAALYFGAFAPAPGAPPAAPTASVELGPLGSPLLGEASASASASGRKTSAKPIPLASAPTTTTTTTTTTPSTPSNAACQAACAKFKACGAACPPEACDAKYALKVNCVNSKKTCLEIASCF